MSTEKSYDFAERFEAVAGVAHVVASGAEAVDAISEIVQSVNAGCIALAGLPGSLAKDIEARCSHLEVLQEPYAAHDLPGAVDAADVGITGVAFGIAQTGTLVEVSTNDAVRLVSALPRTYIGVLHQGDIVDRYEDAAARVRRIAAQHDQHLVISFISGPSRTGDIELKLTLGVHGPEQAHAVIIAER